MTRNITLKIDNHYVTVEEGRTLLDAARESGRFVPTLCQLEGLPGIGACRLCLVEVSGTPRLLPACTTQAAEGMSVTTNSERLSGYRRMIIQLLLAERNHVCAVCVSNGHCELQDMAARLGVTNVPFSYRYPRLEVDASHDNCVLDHNRCILCTRCVRVCAEIEGAHTWDVMGRGIHSMIVSDLAQPWGEASSCTRCGKCVHACPTGALAEKGRAVGEMTKRTDLIQQLALSRGGDS